MSQISRRHFVTMAAGLGCGLAIVKGSGAMVGGTLPEWGATSGATNLRGGPLGLNATSDPGQVPVSISIPDAEVDAEVERQQIVNGQMLDPTGPWVVAWYEQSARAGEIGNFLASGHVDYWGVGPSVFRKVADVPTGGLIAITGKGGTVYTYEVEYVRQIELATVSIEELNSPELVGQTNYAAVSLITCGGTFDYERGEYLYRDLVRGRLVAATTQNVPDATAEQPQSNRTATVNTDNVNMRSDPSTTSDVVRVLPIDTRVTITGESIDGESYTWLPIALEDGTTGWIASDFVTTP